MALDDPGMNGGMSLDEGKKEEFKAKLRLMTDEDIRLALDTGEIKKDTWYRSLAEQERERRERESALAQASQRIAQLELELSRTRAELWSLQSGSVWLRWQTISGWLVAVLMAVALLVGLVLALDRSSPPPWPAGLWSCGDGGC